MLRTSPIPRFQQLAQRLRADLELVLAHHRSQSERYLAGRYLGQLNAAEAAVRRRTGIDAEATASVFLGKFGPNGLLPAIDMMAREARSVMLAEAA